MSLEVVITGETFVTDFTLERLFTCMSALVILKYMFVTKTTITSLASEDLVFAVVSGRVCARVAG
jgi:hypothetical protein